MASSLNILMEGVSVPRPVAEGPKTLEQVKAELVEQGFLDKPSVNNPYVTDGIYVHPKFTAGAEALSGIFKGTLTGLNQVKDNHLPTLSVVQCGFIRAIAVHPQTDSDISLSIFCRFTIDTCPFGLVLTKGMKDEVAKATGISSEKIKVFHGGTPWKVETAPTQAKEIMMKFLKCLPQ